MHEISHYKLSILISVFIVFDLLFCFGVGVGVYANEEPSDTKDVFAEEKTLSQEYAVNTENDEIIHISDVNGLPTKPGNYVLDDDITISRSWKVPLDIEGAVTKLDLQGHSITLQTTSLLPVINVGADYYKGYANLHLYNSSTDAGSGIITGGTAGGVQVSGGAEFHMYGGTISGNNNEESGGGVSVNLSTFYMKGGTIENNKSLKSGGGIYSYNSDCQIGDDYNPNIVPILNKNMVTASNDGCFGGCVCVNGGTLDIYNGTFQNNEADRGGALAVLSSSVCTVYSGDFSDNEALFGAAIYNQGKTYLCPRDGKDKYIQIYKNQTKSMGTIVNNPTNKLDANSLEINNTDIYSNSAGAGGAIYNFNSDGPLCEGIKINSGNIHDNTARCFGGAVVNQGFCVIGGEESNTQAIIKNNYVESIEKSFGAGVVSGNLTNNSHATCILKNCKIIDNKYLESDVLDFFTVDKTPLDLVTTANSGFTLTKYYNGIDTPHFEILDLEIKDLEKLDYEVQACGGRLTNNYSNVFPDETDIDNHFVYSSHFNEQSKATWGSIESPGGDINAEIWVVHNGPHSWNYGVIENPDDKTAGFYAYCSDEMQCVYHDEDTGLKLIAYGLDLVYNGKPQGVYITNNLPEEVEYKVTYDKYLDDQKNKSRPLNSEPVDVGFYSASITISYPTHEGLLGLFNKETLTTNVDLWITANTKNVFYNLEKVYDKNKFLDVETDVRSSQLSPEVENEHIIIEGITAEFPTDVPNDYMHYPITIDESKRTIKIVDDEGNILPESKLNNYVLHWPTWDNPLTEEIEDTPYGKIWRKPIDYSMVKVSKRRFDFDEHAHKPSVNVSYLGDNLLEGQDYEYVCNEEIAAGKFRAYVKGIGIYYTGTWSFEWFICWDLSTGDAHLDGPVLIYNKESQKQEIADVSISGYPLTEGEDYIVKQNEACEPGVYNMILEPMYPDETAIGSLRLNWVILDNLNLEEFNVYKFDSVIGDDAFNADVTSSKLDTVAGFATAEDFRILYDNTTINLSYWIESKNINEVIDKEIKAKFETYMKKIEFDLCQYNDISLFKLFNGETSKIDVLKDPVEIRFVIPDKYINTDPDVLREYKLLHHNHEGIVEEIEFTFDTVSNVVTFSSNEFSEYTLGYKDTPIIPPDPPGPPTPDPVNPGVTPPTLDFPFAFLAITGFLIIASMMIIIGYRKKD